MRPELLEVIYPGREHFERIDPDKTVLDKYHLGSKPFLLTVGSNSPHKNFTGLYEVIKRINPQDYEVVVVGGTYNTVFQQAGGGSDIPACVRRLGYVTDPELKALYQHATAFILPTKYEGFGFPVLEAMTCGCPVVCSHVASLPEVGGDAVLYFDPYQLDDMEEKINQIMSTESLRKKLMHLGKVQAEKFSWQQTAAKVWASLKEFI
jgi:glycosyltransferase involved in cell wall biosynthesis